MVEDNAQNTEGTLPENAEKEVQKVVIRVTGNKEKKLLTMLREMDLPKSIVSIMFSPKLRGYLIIETEDVSELYNFFKDLKYFKGITDITLTDEDINKLVQKEEETLEVKAGDLVRIVSGPFKGEIATVKSVDDKKKEVTVAFIQSSVPIQVNIKISDVTVIKKEEYESNLKGNS